jgi:hypothetical protein
MSLQTKLAALITAFGADIKAINTALSGMGGSITQGDIDDAIAALRLELRAGAGPALDTFAEIEAQLTADAGTAAALAAAIANRVRFDAAQGLTAPQKAQARDNIGAQDAALIGDPDADLVALYNAAKA